MNGVFVKDAGPFSHRIEARFGIQADEIYPLLKTVLHQVRQPGVDSRPLWQPLLDRLGVSYEDFFEFWFEGESLNEELLQYVKELKEKGIKIMVLSNNFPERTLNYRQRFPELFKAVDEQYFSWETGNIKPHSEAYTQIINKHDYLPSEYVYLDDSDDNLAAAAKLGIVTHHFLDLADTEKFIRELHGIE